MLSRRNTRIKVLQALYAFDRDEEMTFEDAKKYFKKLAINTFNLYLFSLYTVVEFCKLAVRDAENRKEKYLPTEEDKNFEPKLFDNEAVQSIYRNEAFQVKCENENFKELLDHDVLKRLYKEFSDSENYKTYLRNSSDEEDHIEILHDAVRFLKNEESFEELMEDGYSNWIDDSSLALGALKRTLKSLPVEESFFMEYYPSKDTTKELGEKLLIKTHEESEKLEEIIEPVLDNWDLDRLATVDLLILKIGITELIHFQNIPSHVTLNEYVELAKLYSTSKSREFINGILDKVLKELQEKGVIDKQDN